MKRDFLDPPKESRSIKTTMFIESQEFQNPRGRVNCQTRAGAPRARDAWRKFTEIYGIPRTGTARALCSYLAPVKVIVDTCAPWNLRPASYLRGPVLAGTGTITVRKHASNLTICVLCLFAVVVSKGINKSLNL
jgi:hypothetical protein